MSVSSDCGSPSLFPRWVNQIQVISNRDSVSGRDLQDFVLDVAVERYVCEGRGRLRSGQDLCVDFPFVAFGAENELLPCREWGR